ncbi:hypothetical protein C1N51_24375 [Vibrio campbellii]|nr:hypothetical protein C1N51_24375 [Vibrio campbellii]
MKLMKNKSYFVKFALTLMFSFSHTAIAQGLVESCDTYLIPKNTMKDGNYYSFMGRTIESHSVHSYVLKQKLSELKASSYDICERNDFSALHRTLNANNFKHLTTVYFDTALYEAREADLSHISSTNEFIDADALLVVGSSSIVGDSIYNLNLSLKRGNEVVEKLKGRKDIFLMNLGAFGQDSSKANEEFYKSKRRSVSIYGLTYE